MNVKHIVMTRFLSRNIKPDILQDDVMKSRLKLLTGNLIPTLNNQTCLEFEFVLLVNPGASDAQVGMVEAAVAAAKPKFKWRTQKHDKSLDDYIGSLWEGNDFVSITRIDDDDFIGKDCFKTLRNHVGKMVPGKGAQVTLCGYNLGYFYVDGSWKISGCDFGYGSSGHMSIFQTYIYDTSIVKYDSKLNPYSISHDIAKKKLEENGYTTQHLSFDDKERKRMDVLYFFNRMSRTMTSDGKKPYKEVLPQADISENMLKELKDRFAFVPKKNAEVKFKHVVLTKFLSKKMNLEDILDDSMLDYRLNLLKGNLFSTLNNQTKKNFELVLLTNPELPDEKVRKINKFVQGIPHEFEFRTIKHDTSIDDYLGGLWKGNDFVAVTRIDDDDFVERDAVKRIQNFVAKLEPGEQEQIQVLGYNKGYMYIEWLKQLGKVDFGFGKSGHIGIFQTFVYDTSSTKYENRISPYVIGHELVRKMLEKEGFTAKAHSLDYESGEPSVVFFLHQLSDSLYREKAKKHKLSVSPIDLTQTVLDGLITRFGFPAVVDAVVEEQEPQEIPQEEQKEPEKEPEKAEEQVEVVDNLPKEFKWYAVPPSCLYGRIDNSLRNFHRVDLKNVSADEEHMAKIMKYAPGVSFVFTTKSKKLTLKYKAHYNKDTYNLPMKSLMEPMVLGLDEYGVWNIVNYIRVFTPEQEKGMRTDQELQFSVGGVDSRPAFDPMEYVKYQISFPTKATILEFAIGADLPVEFEKPGPVDLVFIGSSVAQDNYSSNHMNICPYLYREYRLNCATLGVSQYHTFRCPSLMAKISKLEIPCVLMDVLHISPEVYAEGAKKVKKLNPFIIYKNREEVNRIIRQNGLGTQDLVVMPGDCMWDSVHINDYGTVFYCQKLKERGVPGIAPFYD